MRMWSDIYWVFWREMKHFLLQRARIITSIIQPTIWLVLMGNNLSGLTRNPMAAQALGTGNYLQFMTPGVMIMTALFGGVFGGTSVMWDRRLGFLNKMLAAPIGRASIPLGKLFALMVQSWIQVVVILIVALLLGVRIVTGVPGMLFMILLASLFELVMGGISLSLARI
jgi:ABC-2 type transport system permease protein